MRGEWIEFGGGIFEVLAETDEEFICREVLYMSDDPILRYSNKTKRISKECYDCPCSEWGVCNV